jgi:hypothetical protein
MGAFEHVIVLLSFVYALALTHLLSSIAQLIRAGARVRFSWTFAFWMLNAFLTIIANWIGFWDLRALPSFSMGTVFFTFLMAFVNYLQAALVCPEVGDGSLDLAQFQARQGPRYIAAFLASAVMAFTANFIYGSIYNLLQWTAENLAVIPMIVIAVLALIFRRPAIQFALALISMAVWFYFFAVLQGALH